MVVRPALADLTTFQRATSICAWWQADLSPNSLFFLRAASIISGGAPKNLIPSAPVFVVAITHATACSGVLIGAVLPIPKAVYASMRGAVILLAALLCLWSSTH